MDKKIVHDFIKNALSEDVGDGDHTSLSTIPKNAQGKAKLIIKEDGILAGVELGVEIFKILDPSLKVDVLLQDASVVKVGDIALTVSGSTHSILLAERLVLNCMQRMSGIATKTHHIVEMLKDTKAKLLDTRKTTPGLRYLEKWAVRIGGGVNHRIGLYDMILIKDNHVDYAGGISNAINAAKKYLSDQNKSLQIEVEVRNLDELNQVISTGSVDRIMLDNFDFETLRKAVSLIDGRYITEASGGITEENVVEYADCGVDFISMGALTHSVKSLDMSLKAF
ncbi:carboxylating nicotinate-nucleotide diphosphorylase [Pedobacter changchengzhani]|uniref:Probable nicotinate-nucleotide pyrophosphorylase [carboxylating] n=1 Tax=Pedobacter changchengzhani TaxID=2529274 RepID=A0A4R5MLF6_9SPHI|nr:carboxylating nicotinate-nucleotide diphosphorylase [Pedobacter changchengzhani]TDG36587.1 carboxylating nicotinate-nucleotide diphosphorylase [Pedobacter changchengzhani]